MTNGIKTSDDNRRRKLSVLGSGLIALDLVADSESASTWHSYAGGSCGNVLAILSFLGWSAYPIARLNGDAASQLVREDLVRWGVNLEYASLEPTARTPIVVQTNRLSEEGYCEHRFSWRCPSCGNHLPSFAAVRGDSVDLLLEPFPRSDVFYFDRTSKGILMMAEKARAGGALVYFEPSAKVTPKHMEAALNFSDIVKYSVERFPEKICALDRSDSVRLEIQTHGRLGTEYRYVGKQGTSAWSKQAAFNLNQMKDSAGAGDWFTSALINTLVRTKQDLSSLSKESIKSAIVRASAYAAWSCRYAGARGGMYALSPRTMNTHIKKIIDGQSAQDTQKTRRANKVAVAPECPACA